MGIITAVLENIKRFLQKNIPTNKKRIAESSNPLML